MGVLTETGRQLFVVPKVQFGQPQFQDETERRNPLTPIQRTVKIRSRSRKHITLVGVEGAS